MRPLRVQVGPCPMSGLGLRFLCKIPESPSFFFFFAFHLVLPFDTTIGYLRKKFLEFELVGVLVAVTLSVIMTMIGYSGIFGEFVFRFLF